MAKFSITICVAILVLALVNIVVGSPAIAFVDGGLGSHAPGRAETVHNYKIASVGHPMDPDSKLIATFETYGRNFTLHLHADEHLFADGARVQVYGANGMLMHERTPMHRGYVAQLPSGGWARAVKFPDGRIHAVVHDLGEVYVVDEPIPTSDYATGTVGSANRQGSPIDLPVASHFMAADSNEPHGLQAFRLSDMQDTPHWQYVKSLFGSLPSYPREPQPIDAPYPFSYRPSNLLRRNYPSTNYEGPYGRMDSCPSGLLAVEVTLVADVGFGRVISGGGNTVDESKVEQEMVKIINIANSLYPDQVGVVLQLHTMDIRTGTGGPSWNQYPVVPGKRNQCVDNDIDSVLESFGQWRADQLYTNLDGVVHLLTNCFPAPGTVGYAYTKALCSRSKYNVGWSSYSPGSTWSTVSHEIGHNFGAHHEFDTDGIMSYETDSELEFTGSNPDQICSFLQTIQNRGYWNCLKSFSSTCGNGIVEPGEECDDSTSCCTSSCKLASTAQCTYYNNECCTTSCKYKRSTTTCGTDAQSYCSKGRCATESACNYYSNTFFCPVVSSDPCQQRCKINEDGYCMAAWRIGGAVTTSIANAEEGTVCSTSPYKECRSGQCVSV